MTREHRLVVVLVLNLAMISGLFAVGLVAHSVSVFAEGVDYVADAGGVIVALMAIRIGRRDRDRYARAASVAAAINAGWLLVLNGAVVVAAVSRLVNGHHVHGLPVLVVSAVAAVVMIAAALVLITGNEDRDINVRAVLLDSVADATAAAGVAAAGAIIYFVGTADWLDPAVALVIATVIGYHAAKLLREAGRALRRPRRSDSRSSRGHHQTM